MNVALMSAMNLSGHRFGFKFASKIEKLFCAAKDRFQDRFSKRETQ